MTTAVTYCLRLSSLPRHGRRRRNYSNYSNSSFIVSGWLLQVSSRIIYELDHRKPILNVMPIENILRRLPVVPVGDTGTILHGMRNDFEGAFVDSSPGAGDGCLLWYVNSWAMGWSREL